jgi:hypothetical protein
MVAVRGDVLGSGGDPAAAARLRVAAGRLDEVAAELRLLAGQAARAQGVQWQSTAAEAFRARLAQEASVLHRSAAGVDRAAAAVLRHARAVQGGWSW